MPRLINILCDRALLGGYAARSARVTRAIVRRAAREIAGEVPIARDRRRRRVAWFAGGGAVAVAATVAALMFLPSARSNATIDARPPATQTRVGPASRPPRRCRRHQPSP